jgi:hypothetical protein
MTLRRAYGGRGRDLRAEVSACLLVLTLEERSLVGLYYRAWVEQEEILVRTTDLETPRLQARMKAIMNDPVGREAMRKLGEELARRLW